MNISLDLLERKVLPIRQEEIRVTFNQGARTEKKEKDIEGNVKGNVKGNVEEKASAAETTFKPMAKSAVSVLDKRKQSTLDRAAIIKKLQENKMLTTRQDVLLEPEVSVVTEETKKEPLKELPLATKRKLVIRKPAIEVEETKADEGDEDQEYKDLLAMVNPEVEKETTLEKVESEQQLEPVKIKIKRPRKEKLQELDKEPVDITTAVIRTQKVIDRLPKEREKIIIKASEYYLNNRKIFIQKLTSLFSPYSADILSDSTTASCDTRAQASEFDLLTHQKIVRDYLNLYTPYRGLLLYHGLGSGKTCTSIAIAEGMKSNKRVFILTPASLKMNFFSEMKKCGDALYKKSQFWEFVAIEGNPEYVGILSRALSLSTEYIRNHGGAWLVNVKKEANYTELSTVQQTSLDKQLDEMIRTKYTDINYNGLNRRKIDALTGSGTRNPFDNAVVIIDEAHNMVSRIVNKIKKPDSIAYILYDCLMRASNVKIVLLTGTPIINYPNEIAILYNILRGYIKTWTMTINVKTSEAITTDSITTMLANGGLKTYDFIEYSGNKLTITRNPLGFINTTKQERARKRTEASAQPSQSQGKVTLKLKIKPGEKKGGTTKKRREPLPFLNGLAQKIMAPDVNINDEDDIAYKNNRIGPNFDNNPYKGGANTSTITGGANTSTITGGANTSTITGGANTSTITGGANTSTITGGANTSTITGGASQAFEDYAGVTLDETGNMSDQVFINIVTRILRENGLEVPPGSIEINNYKALPDNSDGFFATFVNTESGEAQNLNLFQRRILGLTSYFRSAQEQMLPSYVKTSGGDIYHVVRVPMSDHQFGIYSKIRKEEADREKANKKRKLKQTEDDPYTISSTYRIFSRAACNFTFPNEITRPIPNVKESSDLTEATFDVVPKAAVDEFGEMGEEEEAVDAAAEMTESDTRTYIQRIEKAMEDVNVLEEGTNTSKYLSIEPLETLSPKFVAIIENIMSEENDGLHLLYSHFRTIEGIGILRLILLANGFAEFKLTQADGWNIVESEEDIGKPKFALYTGTETSEEKEIIRNVFNGAWDFVPTAIAKKLRETSANNMYGEAIKLLMITSSGAEGINLKNTRFVHIVEPYWHMVRIEQVVGRARRICSHQDLPEALRTVKVFLYITALSEEQKADDDNNKELLRRDISRLDKRTPVTTDETLYEMASMKQRINNQILQAVKESAIDCNLYSSTRSSDEPLVCYGFGKVASNAFASHPMFEKDRDTAAEGLDVKTVKLRARRIKIGDENYALNEATMEVYDMESYNRAKVSGTEPILIGRLENVKGEYKLVRV
jgi:hypothetical protein